MISSLAHLPIAFVLINCPMLGIEKKKKVKQMDVILFAGINDESIDLKGRLERVKYSPVHVLSNQL